MYVWRVLTLLPVRKIETCKKQTYFLKFQHIHYIIRLFFSKTYLRYLISNTIFRYIYEKNNQKIYTGFSNINIQIKKKQYFFIFISNIIISHKPENNYTLLIQRNLTNTYLLSTLMSIANWLTQRWYALPPQINYTLRSKLEGH